MDLRFFAELLSVGLFGLREGLNVLAGQLSLLTVGDKEEHNNLTILTSFCRHCGDDYAGLLPRKIRYYPPGTQPCTRKKGAPNQAHP